VKLFRDAMYLDPEKFMEREEKKTCAGCSWVHTVTGVPRCGNGHHTYGKRCEDYSEIGTKKL
jgi:hypothetical protein